MNVARATDTVANSGACEWRHDSDKTQTYQLEWWMILKISWRAKVGFPKTLVKQKLCLHSLYFPQNMLMLTESRREFSDLDSIFRLCALCYSAWAGCFMVALITGTTGNINFYFWNYCYLGVLGTSWLWKEDLALFSVSFSSGPWRPVLVVNVKGKGAINNNR